MLILFLFSRKGYENVVEFTSEAIFTRVYVWEVLKLQNIIGLLRFIIPSVSFSKDFAPFIWVSVALFIIS